MMSRVSQAAALRSFQPSAPLVLLIALVVLVVAFGWARPRFVHPDNFENLLIQTSYIYIFAFAQMLPLLTRGFDLSLGASVSFISVASALAMAETAHLGLSVSLFLGLLASIAFGMAVGATNGALISYLKINPFIVTLGTWNIIGGVAAVISNGFPVRKPIELNHFLYGATVLYLPIPVVISALIFALSWIFLERSVYGRRMYLVGDNPNAARTAGINVDRVIFLFYLMCSVLVAVGAKLMTAHAGSGEPNLGGNLTLQSIAAAVVGGVSLRGGGGRFFSPLLGAVLITVLSSGLNFFRVESYIQNIALGLVIITSVCVDQIRRR